MIKRHMRFIGSMTVGLVVLSTAMALANTKTIQDAQGDQTDSLDIKNASHGHTDTGKLVHKVVTYGNFGERRAGTISISIHTANNDYLVSTFGIWDDNAQTYRDVTVKRPSDNSIKFIFGEGKIGSPSSYRWLVTTVPGYPCPLCPDYAPDEGYVTHPL
jgi:hypothetical protein